MKKSLITLLVFFILTAGAMNIFSAQEFVKTPETKKEMVKVKYIKAHQAHQLLKAYSSPYGRITFDSSLGIITIKDIPEIVDKMLSVLKEIDVRPVDLEFMVDLFLVSISEGIEKVAVISKTRDPIIKELKTLLKLESFELLDKSFARVQENERVEMLIGSKGINLELRLEPRYIKEEKGDIIQVEMRLMQRKVNKEINLIRTALSIRSGERTIVGVSKLDGGEKALVLVLSGKIIK